MPSSSPDRGPSEPAAGRRGRPGTDPGGQGASEGTPTAPPRPGRSRTALAVGLLLTGGALGWLEASLPDPSELRSGWPERTAYMERRLRQLRAGGQPARIRYEPVALEAIPAHVRRAVRVAEDATFWSHHGVDWGEVLAAVREAWREEAPPRGASTITMQLARNLYLSPDRSLWRKFREVLLAWKMESHLSKERILELYLSVVEFGPGLYGVAPAARHYFGKPLSGLSRREAAELAATLPAPLDHNPATRTRWFLWRASLVAERAFAADTPAEAGLAERRPGLTAGGAEAARGQRPPPFSPAGTAGVGLPFPDTVPADSGLRRPPGPARGDTPRRPPGPRGEATSDTMEMEETRPDTASAGGRRALSPPSKRPGRRPPRAAGRRGPTSPAGSAP